MVKLLVALMTVAAVTGVTVAQETENRWEPNIKAFEAKDAEAMPPEAATLFVGSSSIVGWDLSKHLPEFETINRGFGGSQIADSTHFADRIIIPYKPRTVVLYAGDNDIAGGNSPERVAADYLLFVEKVRAGLPDARIIFVAIKPSIARWEMVEAMRRANKLVRAIIKAHDNMTYVDIDAPMIGEDGEPRAELFKDDGLHLNEDGYALWTSIIRPYLEEDTMTETESGLKYKDIVVGDGESPNAGDTVLVHYEGTLMDGTEFDASRKHGPDPIGFPIGVGRVIKGWDEGVIDMKVGGKRKLVIPPDLGYGARGMPPVIPPKATLVFEVELVGIE